MAAGSIFSFLFNLPWRQLVETAPKLADAANRLVDSGKKFWQSKTDAADREGIPSSNRSANGAELSERVAGIERSVAQLESQISASAQIIQQLAQQNAQLVERIDRLQRRLARSLGLALMGLILLGLVSGAFWLTR